MRIDLPRILGPKYLSAFIPFLTIRPLSTLSLELRQRAEKWTGEVEKSFLQLNERLRNKWQDFYKIFRSFENEQALPGQSDIFIPKVWEII